MFFTKKIKTADLITRDYHILPVISRFANPLGLGDKTIEDFCAENNINTDLFLAIINTFFFDEYFAEESLQNIDTQLIINYLKKTHKFFKDYRLKKIEEKLKILLDNCCNENSKKIILLEKFFKDFKKELLQHIEYEDKNLFPLILEIEKKLPNSELKYGTLNDYYKEHSDVEEKLNDFEQIFIKYFPKTANIFTAYEIIEALADFKKDLKDHRKIEERVLIPKIKNLFNNKNNI